MTVPQRYSVVGDWKFVGEGKVLDVHTGKEVNAKLRFKANDVGVETTEEDGVRHAKLNCNFVKDEVGVMWDIVILD